MKKRNRIRVLGQWIDLIHVDLTDEGVHGDCDVESRTIRIHIGLEGPRYTRVLRHELFHMKVGLAGLTELMSPELEEALAVLAETD